MLLYFLLLTAGLILSTSLLGIPWLNWRWLFLLFLAPIVILAMVMADHPEYAFIPALILGGLMWWMFWVRRGHGQKQWTPEGGRPSWIRIGLLIVLLAASAFWGVRLIYQAQPDDMRRVVAYRADMEKDETVIIGNGRYADVRVLDPAAEPAHVAIRRNGDGFSIRNVSLRRRLLVNGSDINLSSLLPGGEIRIPGHRLKLLALSHDWMGLRHIRLQIDDEERTLYLWPLVGNSILFRLSPHVTGTEVETRMGLARVVRLPSDRDGRAFSLHWYMPDSNSAAQRVLDLERIVLPSVLVLFLVLAYRHRPHGWKRLLPALLLPMALWGSMDLLSRSAEGGNIWIREGLDNRIQMPVKVDGLHPADNEVPVNVGDVVLFGHTSYLLERGEQEGLLLKLRNRYPQIRKDNPQSRDEWLVQETNRSAPVSLLLIVFAWWVSLSLLVLFLHRHPAHGGRAAGIMGLVGLLSVIGQHLQISLSLKSPRYETAGIIQCSTALEMILSTGLLLIGFHLLFRRHSGSGADIHHFLSTPLRDGGKVTRTDAIFAVTALLVLVQAMLGGALGIRILGVQVQPFEFGKLLLLLYITQRSTYALVNHTGKIPWDYLPVLVPLLLLVGVGDFSPILLMVAVLWFAWIIRFQFPDHPGMHFSLILLFFAVTALLGLLAGQIAPHVQVRLDMWTDPWTHTSRLEQLLHSFWLIHDGGWLGSGLGSTAAHLLPPRVDDDSVLALLAGELGVVGVVIYISAIVLLGSGLLSMASTFPCSVYKRSHLDQEARLDGVWWPLFICLVAFALLSQALFVLASASGLMPLMGQPLPFISRAGSNTLLFYAPAFAMVLIGHASFHGRQKVLTSR